MTELVLGFIALTFLLATGGTMLARSIGRRLNAMDSAGVAGQIKDAPRRVPNIGGVGIMLGIALPLIAGVIATRWATDDLLRSLWSGLPSFRSGLGEKTPDALVLLGGLLVLHVVGLFDDRRALGPNIKLVIMLLVSATVSWLTNTRLLELLDAHVGGAWLSIAITVLWIVVITNAFNFLDNMDGLSAGVAAICSAVFLTIALAGGQLFVAAMLALLVGALLGFLVFNFPFRERKTTPNGSTIGGASIFMGDGGSLIVGFLIAFLSVRITYVPAPLVSGTSDLSRTVALLLAPLVILAVPLYDFCSVCVIRLSQGRSPFVGDLQHFSHRLVGHGLSRRAAVLVIYGCTLSTGIGAILLPRLEPWQAVLVALQTLLILLVIAAYEWARRPEERG